MTLRAGEMKIFKVKLYKTAMGNKSVVARLLQIWNNQVPSELSRNTNGISNRK